MWTALFLENRENLLNGLIIIISSLKGTERPLTKATVPS
jgi:hypothetical protein